MKKETKILLILLPISIIISFILLIISYNIIKLFTEDIIYKNRNVLTIDNFEKIMTNLNFDVTNEIIPEDEKNISSLLRAYKEDKYEIYLGVYNNNENASKIFNYNESNMKNLINGTYSYSSKNGKYFSKYAATSKEYYIVIIKHKNIIISIQADKKYKKEIKKIIKKLNY